MPSGSFGFYQGKPCSSQLFKRVLVCLKETTICCVLEAAHEGCGRRNMHCVKLHGAKPHDGSETKRVVDEAIDKVEDLILVVLCLHLSSSSCRVVVSAPVRFRVLAPGAVVSERVSCRTSFTTMPNRLYCSTPHKSVCVFAPSTKHLGYFAAPLSPFLFSAMESMSSFVGAAAIHPYETADLYRTRTAPMLFSLLRHGIVLCTCKHVGAVSCLGGRCV